MSQVNIPWFGEGGDPLLPENLEVEVKPILRLFDSYQTHDVIIWKLDRGNPIFNEVFAAGDLKSPFFCIKKINIEDRRFGSWSFSLKGIVIDRLTPDNYPWADQYSDWLKAIIDYCRGLEPHRQYSSQMLGNEILRGYIEVSISDINIRSSGTITWLVGEEDFISKRHVTFETHPDQPFSLLIPLENLCPYSIVVSGTDEGIVNQIESQILARSNLLLYKDIRDFLGFFQRNYNETTGVIPDDVNPPNYEVSVSYVPLQYEWDVREKRITRTEFVETQGPEHEIIETELYHESFMDTGDLLGNQILLGNHRIAASNVMDNFDVNTLGNYTGEPFEIVWDWFDPIWSCLSVLPPVQVVGRKMNFLGGAPANPPTGVNDIFDVDILLTTYCKDEPITPIANVEATFIHTVVYLSYQKSSQDVTNRYWKTFTDDVQIRQEEFSEEKEKSFDLPDTDFVSLFRANNYWSSSITEDLGEKLTFYTTQERENGFFQLFIGKSNLEYPPDTDFNWEKETYDIILGDIDGANEGFFSEVVGTYPSYIATEVIYLDGRREIISEVINPPKLIRYGFYSQEKQRVKFVINEKSELFPEQDFINFVDKYLWEYNENGAYPELIRGMADSIRVKEIHQALDASRYATYQLADNQERLNRLDNLGYRIERISQLLGINVMPDRSEYQPKEMELITPDDQGVLEIEEPYQEKYWGEEFEVPGEDRVSNPDFDRYGVNYNAFAYKIRSKKFREDPTTGEETRLEEGGYWLTHNIPQLIEAILIDLNQAISWEDLGASKGNLEKAIRTFYKKQFTNDYDPEEDDWEDFGDDDDDDRDDRLFPQEAQTEGLIDVLAGYLSIIYAREGLQEYPANIPESLLSTSDETDPVKIQNYGKLYEWYLKQFDTLIGEFPIKLKIEDNELIQVEGGETTLEFPNIAECLAEMLGNGIVHEAYTKLNLNVGTTILGQLGSNTTLSFRNNTLLSAIIEYLGFETKLVEKELQLGFNPIDTTSQGNRQGSNSFRDLLTPTTVFVPTEENTDKVTLEQQLKLILKGAMIIEAVHGEQTDLNDVSTSVRDVLFKTLNLQRTNKPVSDQPTTKEQDFSQWMDDVEDGFDSAPLNTNYLTPYGRSRNQRPKIRRIDNRGNS